MMVRSISASQHVDKINIMMKIHQHVVNVKLIVSIVLIKTFVLFVKKVPVLSILVYVISHLVKVTVELVRVLLRTVQLVLKIIIFTLTNVMKDALKAHTQINN